MTLKELANIYMALLKLPQIHRSDARVQHAMASIRDEIALRHMECFTPEEVQAAFERLAGQ